MEDEASFLMYRRWG